MLGVNRQMLLQDHAKRRKYGRPSELRPARLEDSTANAHHYLRPDSDWVSADITMSTDADQTPLAPDYTVSKAAANGRRTLMARTEAPIHNFFLLQSARYTIKKDTSTGKDGKPDQLSVYFHAPHGSNVQRMMDAMKARLEMFSTEFSRCQFTQAQMLEFPACASFAQSFANTVAYSESIGFNQTFRDCESDEKIDLLSYVTAHELAHQWWAHQIVGANKQGMTLLSESFDQWKGSGGAHPRP